MPKNGETSVFRHGAEPRAELWDIAEELVLSGRTLHGAAIIRAAVVRRTLRVNPSEPPPRHAVIVGWPSDIDPELEKAAHRELAVALAEHSELIRC